ncbi:MAG TPA: hypothetical protein VF599_08105 [Pyrinomonadaceae bacterium]
MQELISALEKTIELLEKSGDSIWSNTTVNEVRDILERELHGLRENQNFSFSGKSEVEFLFLPTGALQEISISNGWGGEYLKISAIVDKYIN